MPIESELRDLFANTTAPRGGIDPAAVIRRSKRRRLPQQVSVGSVLTLAIAGIGIASLNGIRPMLPANTAGGADRDTMAEADDAPLSGGDSSTQHTPADKINPCGSPLAEVAPSATGLELTAHFPPSAPATGQDVVGTVTLTNTGTEAVTGTTAASPAITVSRDGITLWHSNGPMIMLAVVVDLAPGESMDYTASFTPVRCAAEDELGEGFRDGLPALTPGEYRLSAAIDLIRGDVPSELVTGPASTIVLR